MDNNQEKDNIQINNIDTNICNTIISDVDTSNTNDNKKDENVETEGRVKYKFSNDSNPINQNTSINKSALTRIIIWSVVAALLTALMISIICTNSSIEWRGISFGINSIDSYDNEEDYNIGPGNFSDDSIKKIEIEWVSGEVIIAPYSGDTVVVKEEYYNGKSYVSIDNVEDIDEDDILRYLVENNTLKIHSGKSKSEFLFNFGTKQENKKRLTINLPETQYEKLDKLDICVVSADVELKDIYYTNIVIDSVSGMIKATNTDAINTEMNTISGNIVISDSEINDIDIDTVSGNIDMSGDIKSFEANTTSGKINLVSKSCPNEIDCDSISGDVSVSFTESEQGFIAEMDSISGDLECNVLTKKNDDDDIVFGEGKAEFSFDTTSGDVSINITE